MANDDWTERPYAGWLEETIGELVKADPVTIAMEMIGSDGQISTCYYNTSPNDRACMIDAMRDDARLEWVAANRECIKALLDGAEIEDILCGEDDEDDGEDELQGTDTEAD